MFSYFDPFLPYLLLKSTPLLLRWKIIVQYLFYLFWEHFYIKGTVSPDFTCHIFSHYWRVISFFEFGFDFTKLSQRKYCNLVLETKLLKLNLFPAYIVMFPHILFFHYPFQRSWQTTDLTPRRHIFVLFNDINN